jgi:hypothetical protein
MGDSAATSTSFSDSHGTVTSEDRMRSNGGEITNLAKLPSGGSVWVDQRGSEVLERIECLRLLALGARSGKIGRLGLSTETSPLIFPVNFSYHDEMVIIRVGPGLIGDLAPGQLVAFEVDHVDMQAGVAWSVLLRGLAEPLQPDRASYLPVPLVPRPGEQLISLRSDVLTGRRFGFPPAP